VPHVLFLMDAMWLLQIQMSHLLSREENLSILPDQESKQSQETPPTTPVFKSLRSHWPELVTWLFRGKLGNRFVMSAQTNLSARGRHIASPNDVSTWLVKKKQGTQQMLRVSLKVVSLASVPTSFPH
jgi:hypothetical protein